MGPRKYVDNERAPAGRVAWFVDRWGADLILQICCVLAVPMYMYLTREQWFHQDEFALLIRQPSSVGDLFAPHNEHMIVPTRIVYAALWPVFAMRSYEPYQLFVIVAHVATVWLVYRVMRRSEVNQWLAAVCAVVLLTFGRASYDLVWGFQLTFTGALLAGYAQLLLADHVGPIGRRDAAAVLCGFVAVTSSAPGLVMVGVVGLAILIRRGLVAALLQVLPPGVLMVGFTLSNRTVGETASPRAVIDFVGTVLHHTGGRLTPNFVAAFALVVLVLAGLAATVRASRLGPVLKSHALPFSLAVGALAFLLLTGYGRAGQGMASGSQPRYSHVVAAMLLPLVAVGLQGVVKRQQMLLVPIALLILWEVPANIEAISAQGSKHHPAGLIMATALSERLDDTQPSVAPFFEGTALQRVTAGWLLSQREAGHLGEMSISPDAQRGADAALSFDIAETSLVDTCQFLEAGETVTVDTTTAVTLTGAVLIQPTFEGKALSLSFYEDDGYYEVTTTDPEVTFELKPYGLRRLHICTG